MQTTDTPNGTPPADPSTGSGHSRWVILEAMGHIKVAGRYYVENGLRRVDIPDPSDPEHYRTEWFGNAAIFRITPVDELTARKVAASSVIPDAIPWDVRHQLKQLAAPQETIEGESQEKEYTPSYEIGERFEEEFQDYEDDEDDDRPDAEDIPF